MASWPDIEQSGDALKNHTFRHIFENATATALNSLKYWHAICIILVSPEN